jgi:hypothetical protein
MLVNLYNVRIEDLSLCATGLSDFKSELMLV